MYGKERRGLRLGGHWALKLVILVKGQSSMNLVNSLLAEFPHKLFVVPQCACKSLVVSYFGCPQRGVNWLAFRLSGERIIQVANSCTSLESEYTVQMNSILGTSIYDQRGVFPLKTFARCIVI